MKPPGSQCLKSRVLKYKERELMCIKLSLGFGRVRVIALHYLDGEVRG